MTYKPLFNYRTLKIHSQRRNLEQLQATINQKLLAISPDLTPLSQLIFQMIDPNPRARPTAAEALSAFCQPVFGLMTDKLLYFDFLTRSRSLLLPDHRQLFRALFLEFLRREGHFGNRLDLEIPLNMIFIKNIDMDGFFDSALELIRSRDLRVLFQGNSPGSKHQANEDHLLKTDNILPPEHSEILESKQASKIFSLSQSFDIINKDLTPNMLKRPTHIETDNDRSMSMTKSKDDFKLYKDAPDFICRFARFLTVIRVQSHAVIKFKYHTLPSFEQVLHSVHNSKIPSKQSTKPQQNEKRYNEQIQAMIQEFQKGFDPMARYSSIWAERTVQNYSKSSFSSPSDNINNPQTLAQAQSQEESQTRLEPESSLPMTAYVLFKEILLDLQNCLYSETMCWSLDILAGLSPLVDPLVLVLYAFPILQNLHKKPYRVSPLKLFRSIIRIAGNIQSIPQKILSSLPSLEDYLFFYLKSIFLNGKSLLVSELISSLGRPNYL